MLQIADWLEKLGMSEYAQRFAENRIDFSALPDLTDSDLKDLGVVLGDRRKIMRAIAKLDADARGGGADGQAAVHPLGCDGTEFTDRGRVERAAGCDAVRERFRKAVTDIRGPITIGSSPAR